jgi:hypothetical protein
MSFGSMPLPFVANPQTKDALLIADLDLNLLRLRVPEALRSASPAILV